MEGSLLTTVVLPFSLFVIMLGMGLALKPSDFTEVLKNPKPALIGIFCQLLILPLLAIVLASLFNLPPPLAIGLIVLGLSPSGVTSNMFTFLAKGNVALSISLSGIISLITPLTIPIFLSFTLPYYSMEEKVIQLPVGKTIISLIAITIFPVTLGILSNKKWPNFSLKIDKPLKIFSIVLLFAIVAAIAKKEWVNLPDFFAQVGWSCLLLNISSLIIGFMIANIAKLDKKDVKTISLEVGIQNGTTALFITGTLLGNSFMSIPPAVYSLIMFATGSLFAVFLANR